LVAEKSAEEEDIVAIVMIVMRVGVEVASKENLQAVVSVIVVAAESVIAAVIVAVIVIGGLVDQEWIEKVSLTVRTKIW
jgi:hypothetical protein